MASRSYPEYPYPWTAPPLTTGNQGWWGNAKNAFLRPWRKQQRVTSPGEPKRRPSGKKKQEEDRKGRMPRKKNADQLQYQPRTQQEYYAPYSTPEIPVFVPRFTNLSPFQNKPDNKSTTSTNKSSSSLEGEFEIPKADDKPVRPLLSNIFPMYDSPSVTPQKPKSKGDPLQDEPSRRFSRETTDVNRLAAEVADRLSSRTSSSSSSQHSVEEQHRRAEPVLKSQKSESDSSSESESSDESPVAENHPSARPQSRRLSPYCGPTAVPDLRGFLSQEQPRRHSTGTTAIERTSLTPAQRPSSAQSTTSTSSEHSFERRQRRTSAVRALPVVPKRTNVYLQQRKLSPTPAPIEEETESDARDSPTGFHPRHHHQHPPPRQIPSRNNLAYRPWPPDNAEDVFSQEVYQKLQSPTKQSLGPLKAVGKWVKGKSKGKAEDEAEDEEEEIKGFDSFMMY